MNYLYTSTQTVTLATGETYTLKADEVMINKGLYKKIDLEISIKNNDAQANEKDVKIGIYKRDGKINLPSVLVSFSEWAIDDIVQISLSTAIENISVAIR